MNFDYTQIFDYALLLMMLAVGVAVIRLRNLFAVVMLTGVYSLLSAAWFVSLDALDVGFTEAAVGAGISTVLLLAAAVAAVMLISGRVEPHDLGIPDAPATETDRSSGGSGRP